MEAQFQLAWVLQSRWNSYAEQANGRSLTGRLEGWLNYNMENHPWSLRQEKVISAKVNKGGGTAPTSDIDILAEWKEYFSFLINNSNDQSPSIPVAVTCCYGSTNRDQSTNKTGDTVSHTSNGDQQSCWTWCNAIKGDALQNGDAKIDAVHGFSLV